METIRRFLLSVFIAYVFSGTVYAGNTAGGFELPFDVNQRWKYADGTTCPDVGYKTPADQIFMQLYPAKNKYHLAEDWNGKCGGSTDLGAPLFAIADGMVQDIRDPGRTDDGFGKLLLIRLTLPDETKRDFLYEHILDIANNPRSTPSQKFKAGDAVKKGELMAHLGDGNGQYIDAAHLHIEERRDTSIDILQTPYYNPLLISTALKYTSPSLFIDDRRVLFPQSLTNGSWTYIAWYFNAPSSTAFIEYQGERYSLKRAVQLGYIYQYLYEQRSGQWYYYSDIANVFFGAGNTYAVWSFVNGAVLNILVPGHNFKPDRAKIDMLHRAVLDSRFTDIKTQIWSETLSWDPAWELSSVSFGFNGGTLTMYHATNKTNPLIRFVGFYDPATGGQWTGWTQVNPNTLD